MGRTDGVVGYREQEVSQFGYQWIPSRRFPRQSWDATEALSDRVLEVKRLPTSHGFRVSYIGVYRDI